MRSWLQSWQSINGCCFSTYFKSHGHLDTKLGRDLEILGNQSAHSSHCLTLFPQCGMNVDILIFMLVQTVAYFISHFLGSGLEYFQFPDRWGRQHYLCY